HFAWHLCRGERWALPEQGTFIHRVLLSPDGRTAVSINGKDGLKSWDLVAGKETSSPWGQADQITSYTRSPDGALEAIGRKDGTVELWDQATRRRLGKQKGHVGSVSTVAFAPDGRALATGGQDRVVKIW